MTGCHGESPANKRETRATIVTCQLLVEHVTPMHIASIGGTFRAWVDGAETTLPPSPYRWFVSFPRDES